MSSTWLSEASGYRKMGCLGTVRGMDVSGPKRGMDLLVGGEDAGQVDTVIWRISIFIQDSDQQ